MHAGGGRHAAPLGSDMLTICSNVYGTASRKVEDEVEVALAQEANVLTSVKEDTFDALVTEAENLLTFMKTKAGLLAEDIARKSRAIKVDSQMFVFFYLLVVFCHQRSSRELFLAVRCGTCRERCAIRLVPIGIVRGCICILTVHFTSTHFEVVDVDVVG